MQLQDEEGPPEAGRRGPSLIAAPCVTYDIVGWDSPAKRFSQHVMAEGGGVTLVRVLVRRRRRRVSLPEAFLDVDGGRLHNVRCRSLNGGVHRLTLSLSEREGEEPVVDRLCSGLCFAPVSKWRALTWALACALLLVIPGRNLLRPIRVLT